MDPVPDVHPGTNGQVPSNESTPTLYENGASNSSLEILAPLDISPETSKNIVNEVSNLQASEEEDISIALMSTNILEIIFDYALNKFDDCRDRLEAGRPKFIQILNKFVRAGVRIDMCLPAFPFKSANKVYKAFGFLPDKAEEIALSRLHDMCRRIEEIYAPGATVVVISDGLVYNGLFHNIHH